MIRRITIDAYANVYEVSGLIDQFGKDTEDPILAVTCVIKLAHDRWLPQETIDIPIYTVH